MIIFDLDGTLADTFTDIAHAANHALAACGWPTRDVAFVRSKVGHGLKRLVVDCTGADPDDPRLEEAVQALKNYYAKHLVDHTHLYPHVEETLRELRRRGAKLAILSNKSHELTKPACDALGLSALVDEIVGESERYPRKPAPEAVRHLIKSFGATPATTLVVGDGDADFGAARAAGCDFVGVSWGLNGEHKLREQGVEVVIHSMDDLCRIREEEKFTTESRRSQREES
ncbi:MAG: HAD family hydrolase [bacterium]